MSPTSTLIAAIEGSGDLDECSGEARLYVEARRLAAAIARSEGTPSPESHVVERSGESFDYAFYGRFAMAGRRSRFDQIRLDDEGRVVRFQVDQIPVRRLVRSFSCEENLDVNAVIVMDNPWSGLVKAMVIEGGPLDWESILASRVKPETMPSLPVEIDTVFGSMGELGSIGYRCSKSPATIHSYQLSQPTTVFPGDCTTVTVNHADVLKPGAVDGAAEVGPLAPLGHSDCIRVVFPADGQRLDGTVLVDLTRTTNPSALSQVSATISSWLQQEVSQGYFDFEPPEIHLVHADEESIELRYEVDVGALLAIHHLARRFNGLSVMVGPLTMTLHA